MVQTPCLTGGPSPPPRSSPAVPHPRSAQPDPEPPGPAPAKQPNPSGPASSQIREPAVGGGQSGKAILEEIPDTRCPVTGVRGTLTRRDCVEPSCRVSLVCPQLGTEGFAIWMVINPLLPEPRGPLGATPTTASVRPVRARAPAALHGDLRCCPRVLMKSALGHLGGRGGGFSEGRGPQPCCPHLTSP